MSTSRLKCSGRKKCEKTNCVFHLSFVVWIIGRVQRTWRKLYRDVTGHARWSERKIDQKKNCACMQSGLIRGEPMAKGSAADCFQPLYCYLVTFSYRPIASHVFCSYGNWLLLGLSSSGTTALFSPLTTKKQFRSAEKIMLANSISMIDLHGRE